MIGLVGDLAVWLWRSDPLVMSLIVLGWALGTAAILITPRGRPAAPRWIGVRGDLGTAVVVLNAHRRPV